jgi:hypothetical protein
VRHQALNSPCETTPLWAQKGNMTNSNQTTAAARKRIALRHSYQLMEWLKSSYLTKFVNMPALVAGATAAMKMPISENAVRNALHAADIKFAGRRARMATPAENLKTVAIALARIYGFLNWDVPTDLGEITGMDPEPPAPDADESAQPVREGSLI